MNQSTQHDVVVIRAREVRDIIIPLLAKELAEILEYKEMADFNTSCDWYTTRAQLLKDLRLMTGLDKPEPRKGCVHCGWANPVDHVLCAQCGRGLTPDNPKRPLENESACDHCGTVLPETRLRHFRLCQDCIGLHTPLPDKIKRWVTYHQATGRPDWIERWDYEPKARPFEVGRVALEVPA